MKKVVFLPFSLVFLSLGAQQTSDWHTAPEVSIGGYLDVFYAYDFNRPKMGDKRQPFLYNHNRQNEININQAYFKVAVKNVKYRANFALQYGTYMLDNYAREPNFVKNIYEANVGFSLNRKNTLWMDGGIFASHIGFESADSYDNWTLTRSILAENSPYYELGAKLTYNPSVRWEISALILNGWQRIYVQKNHLIPSFGTQLKYTPNERLLLNWSTFIGSNDGDNIRRLRLFNNVYGQVSITKKLGVIAGFDIGAQQFDVSSKHYDIWLSPVVIAHYAFTEKWALALRGEYYYDPTGIMVPISNFTGSFRAPGLSLNVDYKPIPIIALRAEARWLHNQDNYFERHNASVKNDVFVVLSATVKYMRVVMKGSKCIFNS